VRTSLELIALHRICEADRFPDLEELAQCWLVDETERVRDATVVADLDERFHNGLVAAAGNREMARIHADLQQRIRIIRRLDFTVPARIDDAYLHHGEILNAVLARNHAKASQLLRAHIEASKREIRHLTLHHLSMARGLIRDAH
jgi:DNA-binding GntR family transcriptional regulator